MKELFKNHFDKILWAFLVVFFSAIAVHVSHHGGVDDKITEAIIGGITASLGSLGILSNTARQSNRSSDGDGNGKPLETKPAETKSLSVGD